MESITKYLHLLGLTEDASPQEAKEAYRDLVKVWHPDRFGSDLKLQKKADIKLQEINVAYEKVQVYFANHSKFTSANKSYNNGAAASKQNSSEYDSSTGYASEEENHYYSNFQSKNISEKDYARWKEDVSLDIKIGSFMPRRLIITPENISLDEQIIRVNEIIALRWSSLHAPTNGMTLSYVSAFVKDNHQTMKIDCVTFWDSLRNIDKRYELVTSKLWKIVGVRLVEDTLRRLSSDEKIEYGNLLVDSHGILFQNKKVYSEWKDLSIATPPHRLTFIVTAKNAKDVSEALYYGEVDNVVILDPIMRFLWKDGNYKKLERHEFK
ncbi:MAG: J domain-containing protein [Nitrospirae bacterium]|nr:J domain-containing protein [Nitrospirota bacterium]